MANKVTTTPNGQNFFIYRATPLRTHFMEVFKMMPEAHDFARVTSTEHESDIISVVNSNGVCVGKYSAGKYYI